MPKDIESIKARATVADFQAGRVAEIADDVRWLLQKEGVSIPLELRGMLQGLVEHADAVSRAFAAVNAVHEQHVKKAKSAN
jgi:hypothetical protein